MAEHNSCLLAIAIFASLLSFSVGIPIVKNTRSSGEYEVLDLKKENSIAQLHQKEDSSSDNLTGRKRHLLYLTSVTDQASSTFSPEITKTSFISNPTSTDSKTTNEHASTTPLPTISQGTALTSEQSKNAISSNGEIKEVTATINGKYIKTTTLSPETAKNSTENSLLIPASASTRRPIAKHLLENKNANVEESPKSQANDYRDKAQSVQEKILLPVKDIYSNQGKTVIYTKENTVSINNLSTAPTFPNLPTATAHNLIPLEVLSNKSYETSTLGESMTGEAKLDRTPKTSRENGTFNPVTAVNIEVKENIIKIISSQNDAIPLFVQKLLSPTNKSGSEVEISRNKQFPGKENVPSQNVKKDSLNKAQATSPTTEGNKNLPNIPSIKNNSNPIYLLPLPFSSSQLKNSSNISGSYSVENVMEKEAKSDSKIVAESTTAPVIFGRIEHRQEKPINQDHPMPINKNLLSSTNKFIPPELSSNKNVLEHSTVSTKHDDKDVSSKNNITDKHEILRLVEDNNENGILMATEEIKNKETIMDEYTRFVLSHYFDIQDSEKDSNDSNLTSPGLFFVNKTHSLKPTDTPGNKRADPNKTVSSSDTNKHMDLFFLSVFSSWANNYTTGSTENRSKEDTAFLPDTMVTAELTSGMTAEDGLENGTTVDDKPGLENLAKKDESSIQGITAELTTKMTVNNDLKDNMKTANKTEVEKLMQDDKSSSSKNDVLQGSKLNHIQLSNNVMEMSEIQELFNDFHNTTVRKETGLINLGQKNLSLMPRSTAKLTTAITIESDEVKNKNELQKLAQKDVSSTPEITAEITTGITVKSDLENNTKVASKNGLEKLMQEDTSSSPNKDDRQGSNLNHIPLSKNELEISEMQELFNSFHLPSTVLLKQSEDII